MDNKDVILPVILFFAAFYVWTLPIQSSPLPFGEGDAAWHFGIGDFISSGDKTIDRLPSYIGFWYYLFNPVIGPNALEYPPSNHINYALMQAFAGGRFVPVYIYKAIASFLGVFAVYFLVRKLYGSMAAFVAGFGMVFSQREIMTYLWGQQPTLISIVIVPAVLYAFYMYLTSLFDGRPKNVYMYMTALLIASQYLLHIQGVLVSAVVMAVFSAFMLVKHKRLPLKRLSFVHVAICAAVLLVFVLPFISIYLGPESDIAERGVFGRLFSWTIDSGLQEGAYPDAYFSFSSNYSWLLLPFIVAGVAFIMLRRQNQDLLMISWLIGVYIILHLDVLVGASIVRVARMLVAEPQIMFSLAAVGAVSLPGLIRVPGISRAYLKLGLSAVAVIVVVSTIGAGSFALLSSSYQGISRISQEQLDAAVWISANTPDDAVIVNVGTISYPKMRFMHVLSQRVTSNKPSGFSFQGAGIYPGVNLTPTHYVFDYSDIVKLGANEQAAQLYALEQQLNATKVYDRGNIKVYGVVRAG
ncbi:glycosyltransferase family 39 protein [Candidatus Woesearchaeota archaeon]|nr:glycosyltransferase family 39 protein [Candidatus Woesearchaeota archaeon]